MSADATRPDIPAVPTIDADAPAVASPAPAPVERPATATGPAGGNWRERAERAEAKLAEVRSALLEGGQGDATARCRAIAIVGTGGEANRG